MERALAIVAIVLLAACGATQRQGSERSRRIRAAKSAAWLQAAHESDDRYFVAKLWGAVLLCDGFYPAMAQLGRSDEIERLCAALPGERRRDAPPDEQGPIGVRVRRIFCGGVAGPSGPGQVYREQRLCRGRHGWVELLVPY